MHGVPPMRSSDPNRNPSTSASSPATATSGNCSTCRSSCSSCNGRPIAETSWPSSSSSAGFRETESRDSTSIGSTIVPDGTRRRDQSTTASPPGATRRRCPRGPARGREVVGSSRSSTSTSRVGHRDVPHPLVVGRHDVPRRPVGGGGGDRLVVAPLVVVPLAPGVEVAALELPVLLGIVDARLEPLPAAPPSRCGGTPSRSIVPSSVSMRSNSRMWRTAARHCLVVDHADDPGRDHVLVVRAVHHAEDPPRRARLVDAPQVVVGQVARRRRLEVHDRCSPAG